MAKWAVWEGRKARIEWMVGEGMTDAEVGEEFDTSAVTVCGVRKRLGIPSRFVPRIRPDPAPEPILPPPVETYVDDAGRTVKRYPPRYADGAFIQSVTARPRR